ncbi:Thioredoxin-like protein [Actinidia chinensis var. chinensis]|uniref:Thioredoxin-like protein n=1 Tax=Actinidia chinensis var. chinensis TaxID=1590841 RepID=A0A2R6R9S9_ACTCC|nr:Thioredoxin-like protein [Actinidia chinensis var. chinensis]
MNSSNSSTNFLPPPPPLSLSLFKLGIMLSVPSIFSSRAPPSPPPLSLSNFPFKTHNRNLLFPTTTTRPSLLSAPISPSLPRKLLCRPPSAKYVREDYLVKKLSAKEVQELVKGERNVPLIIDFYATWCGPCILMAQELEMLAVEYESNALIVKVDTDDEYEFARDMQVRGLPTLYFISPDPNKEAIRTEGLIPIQMMRDIIDNQM